MRPSDTQLAIEKGVRLEPLREAVLAEGADLRSDEIVALVKNADRILLGLPGWQSDPEIPAAAE